MEKLNKLSGQQSRMRSVFLRSHTFFELYFQTDEHSFITFSLKDWPKICSSSLAPQSVVKFQTQTLSAIVLEMVPLFPFYRKDCCYNELSGQFLQYWHYEGPLWDGIVTLKAILRLHKKDRTREIKHVFHQGRNSPLWGEFLSCRFPHIANCVTVHQKSESTFITQIASSIHSFIQVNQLYE